jgi:hypothetical protein
MSPFPAPYGTLARCLSTSLSQGASSPVSNATTAGRDSTLPGPRGRRRRAEAGADGSRCGTVR